MTTTYWPRCACRAGAKTVWSDGSTVAPYCPVCMLLHVSVPHFVEDAIRASERAAVVALTARAEKAEAACAAMQEAWEAADAEINRRWGKIDGGTLYATAWGAIKLAHTTDDAGAALLARHAEEMAGLVRERDEALVSSGDSILRCAAEVTALQVERDALWARLDVLTTALKGIRAYCLEHDERLRVDDALALGGAA